MFWRTALLFLAALLPFSPLPVHAGTFVQFRTSIGDIELELYDEDKPVTVTNFLYYVKTGYTNNMFIHRWDPNFVIQGGLAYMANRQTAPSVQYISTLPPIVNEYSVGRIFSNTRGTIAMARSSQVNSATSQWFINLSDSNAFLDSVNGGFTVFGRVIGGFNVLDKFTPSLPQEVWQKTGFAAPFNELPLVIPPPTDFTIPVNAFLYVDITLLNVRLTNTGPGKQITWRSVKDKVNYVEYTTVFPPAWQTLSSPVGTGNDLSVTDTAGDAKRFYRVRVEY